MGTSMGYLGHPATGCFVVCLNLYEDESTNQWDLDRAIVVVTQLQRLVILAKSLP